MKAFFYKNYGFILFLLFTESIAQITPCEFHSIENGILSINTTVNTLIGIQKNAVHYWQFEAIKGTTYSFKIPQNSYENSFSFRILNKNYQSKNLIQNYNNYFTHFICDTSGVFTLLISPNNCNIISDFDLQYFSHIPPKPTVTGFLGQPTIRNRNITLIGIGFDAIEQLEYNTFYGKSSLNSFSFGSKRDTIIINSYDLEEGIMNLTGAFGTIETPYFKFVSKTPIITGIYPTSGTINGQISILGSNLEDVRIIKFLDRYYNSSDNYRNYSDENDSFISFYTSSFINGVISLTGNFGVVTVLAQNMFLEPIITNIKSNLIRVDSEFLTSLFGNNLNSIYSISYLNFENEISKTNINEYEYVNNCFVIQTPNDCKDGVLTILSGFGKSILTVPDLISKPTQISTLERSNVNPGDLNFFVGEGIGLIYTVSYKTIHGTESNLSVGRYYNLNAFYVKPDMASGFLTISGFFGLKEIPTFQKVTHLRPFVRDFKINNKDEVTLFGRNFKSINEIYCETNDGLKLVYRLWDLRTSNYLINFTLPKSVISGNITITGGFGSIKTRIKINPKIETPIISPVIFNISEYQNRLLISATGLDFVEKIYYHTKHGINSTSNLNYIYSGNIYEGNITFTGLFGNVIAPYKITNFCNKRLFLNGGINITSTPKKTFAIYNNIYFWSFTGSAFTNYQIDISKKAMIFIYDLSKNLVTNNKNGTALKWFCSKSEVYYVSIGSYDCSPITEDIVLTYQTFETQPKPIVEKVILDNRIYKFYFTGTGINEITEILYNTDNGIESTSSFNINSETNEVSIYSFSKDVKKANITLVGTFGIMEVPLEIIKRDIIPFESDISIPPVLQDLLIYPNPTEQRFFVESNISSFLKIYDMNGTLTHIAAIHLKSFDFEQWTCIYENAVYYKFDKYFI